MLFQLLSNNKLKIILEEKDMHEYKLDYAELDYENAKTKKIVCTLLTKAQDKTGFDSSDGKVLVEVFPQDGGGCVFYFTLLERQAQKSRLFYNQVSTGLPFLFSFATLENLLAYIKAAPQKIILQYHKCQLYSYKEKYILTFFCTRQDEKGLRQSIGEYGKYKGEGRAALAVLQEHGQCIINQDALIQLAKLV